MEQHKGIKKEFRIDTDGKDKIVEKLREWAEKLKMPEAFQKVFSK